MLETTALRSDPTFSVLGCHAFCAWAEKQGKQKARQPAGKESSFSQYALGEITGFRGICMNNPLKEPMYDMHSMEYKPMGCGCFSKLGCLCLICGVVLVLILQFTGVINL